MPAFERLITSINKNIFIWHKQLHESWAKFYARLKSLYFSQILLLNVFLTIQHHPRLTPSISNNYTFPIIKYYSQFLTNLKLQWTCSLYNLSVVSNVIFCIFTRWKYWVMHFSCMRQESQAFRSHIVDFKEKYAWEKPDNYISAIINKYLIINCIWEFGSNLMLTVACIQMC